MARRGGAEARDLVPGLYEELVSARIAADLEAIQDRAQTGPLSPDEAPGLLAAYVAGVVERVLSSPGLKDDAAAQLALSNRVIRLLSQGLLAQDPLAASDVLARSELLRAVLPDASFGLGARTAPPRPLTPLTQDALLVQAPHEPQLAAGLNREIASSDRIDLLCAFVVWSGVRVLLDELKRARDRGVPIRVLTTTYTGTTDQRSLDELSALGAEIKVSYDTRATRLHAKAWLFERASGFSTGYIGSSNLTHSALHEGLEWNVRLAQARSPGLLDRFRAAFETYWADPRFEPYDPRRFTEERERQQQPRESASGSGIVQFDIRPFPYQEEMLRRLEAERVRHNRWRNLLVAATGTGKTVVAALDYRRLSAAWSGARLLFVAHREEILHQSLGVFRTVMHDGSFGELMVAGKRPVDGTHVFASIQSLSHVDLSQVAPDYYDVVIVDEFHHAEAPTYRRLLEHVRPRMLLGLTATPERMDPTEDVTAWFDGHISYELRLWDALDQRLLCPFQYFGVADSVALTDVAWKRGGYDLAELSRIYTGNDARVARLLDALTRYVLDSRRMRALGFCVSVEHAAYMARRFSEAGIPSVAITGETPAGTRSQGLQQLRDGAINVIFAVDVFNEGLDLPEIDTLLLLRPTESATVFLQQLGRGLRFAPGKAGLTVLDLIGQQRAEFRFEPRFAALTRLSRRELVRAIEQDFPYLPSGCTIQLERVARETVLANVRDAVSRGPQALLRDLKDLGPAATLAAFLDQTGRGLDEVYASNVGGWTALRRTAGFAVQMGPQQKKLEAAVGRLRHLDDAERVAFYSAILSRDTAPEVAHLPERERRLLTMLHFGCWDQSRDCSTLQASMDAIWPHAAIRDEMVQLLQIQGDMSESIGQGDPLGADVPLTAHQRYTRNEILAALGEASVEHPRAWREGVLYASAQRADILTVTLQKTAGRFSPSTMYRDYALAPDLFHWESQSTTSVRSETGQRYLRHRERGSRVLILARESTQNASGRTLPFLFLGLAQYVEHRGDRPISITWRLEVPMPPEFFLEARAVA